MDLIKCAIAYELKRFMTDKVITIMNRVVGSILILFGIYLIVSAFTVIDIPTMSSVVG
jgi:threonine/homoserine/homoserine lactone efflux protein